MTNIAPFATQTVQTGATAQAGATTALSGAQGGVFGALAGMNFMDMIFARTNTAATGTANIAGAAPAEGTVLKAPVTVHPEFAVNSPVVTAEQLALTQQGAKPAAAPIVSAAVHREAGIDIEELTALLAALAGDGEVATQIMTIDGLVTDDAAAALTTAEAAPVLTPAQRQEMVKIIRNLLQGLPAQNQPADAAITADAALIATPLTPATLTELMEKLQAQKQAAENIVKIATPKNPAQAQDGDKTGTEDALNAAIVMPFMAAPLNDTTVATADDLAANMNAITPAAGREAPLALPQPGQPGAQAAQNMAGGYVPNAAANGNNNGAQPAGGSSFAAAQGAAAESMLNGADWDSVFPDGLDWAQGGTGHNSLNLTGATQFASLVAHAHSAATPHPATQVVAATLHKVAQDGESKSLTLKLDPPELGRIEIRMDFGKEKGMKAHIVMEKPETYMMMQRDAHVLERALQDAGIDSNGGLSFELAQDGNLFGDGHEGQNRHGGGSGGSADAGGGAEEIVIETTMNWSVDANGITHYDILA